MKVSLKMLKLYCYESWGYLLDDRQIRDPI